tara:strand:- start:3132 stop:3770 length:639 start_codon:yes stop_codon:yes gene_type:complete
VLEILFEDNHLLVVKKEKGMLSQIDPQGRESVESLARVYLKKKHNKPGDAFVHAVHRLDKDVGGVLLLAKTSKSLKRLQEVFRLGKNKKIYHALLEGIIKEDEGVLEDYLFHGAFKARCVDAKYPKSKYAKLKYRVLKKYIDQTLVEVELLTGRYHQIRIQWSSRGYPIIGDRQYGSTTSLKNGIALEHVALTLPHPISRELKTFRLNTKEV